MNDLVVIKYVYLSAFLVEHFVPFSAELDIILALGMTVRMSALTIFARRTHCQLLANSR